MVAVYFKIVAAVVYLVIKTIYLTIKTGPSYQNGSLFKKGRVLVQLQ